LNPLHSGDITRKTPIFLFLKGMRHFDEKAEGQIKIVDGLCGDGTFFYRMFPQNISVFNKMNIMHVAGG